jgi:hypothetical protein
MPTRDNGWGGLAGVLLACAIGTALSLLWASQPSYDPYAWLIWGREIVHGDLSTVAGPSWKPLPMLFTTPFALFGDAAPTLWVFVGRLGGVVSIVLAYRLAGRLAGRWAAVVAGGALLLAEGYLLNFGRGTSEGLLVALALGAVECHVAGAGAAGLALLVGAALVRPEVWPFAAAYAVWFVIARARRRGTVPCGTIALLAAAAVLVLLAWFLPEKLGSGSFLRGASRAQEPVSGSPAQAARPFIAVFTHSASSLAVPVYVAAALGVLLAARDRERPAARTVLVLAAVSALLMVAVGVLAEAGFTGNPRYVTLPAALVCVLAGVGCGWSVTWARRRLTGRRSGVLAYCLLALAVAALVPHAIGLGDDVARLRTEGRLYAALPDVVAAAGGPAALKGCGGVVFTGPFQTQALAWTMGLHEHGVGIHPRPPGVVIMPDYRLDEVGGGFPITLTAQHGWTVVASCRPLGAQPS